MNADKPKSCLSCTRAKECIVMGILNRRDNPELKSLLTVLPRRCKMFGVKEPKKDHSKAIELGFHDDTLLSLTIDAEKMEAVLRIQTYNWVEMEHRAWKEGDEKEPTGKCFRAEDSKIVELILDLEEEHPFFKGELHTILPNDDIFGIYIDGDTCYVNFCVYSELMFKIKKYEIREAQA